VRIGLGGSAKSLASSTSYSITYYMQKVATERKKPAPDRSPGAGDDGTGSTPAAKPARVDVFERICHVVRFYQDDDPTSGTWIDVERLDQLNIETGSGPTWKRTEFRFDWTDFDPNDPKQGYFKTIVNPNDPEVTIKVPVRHNILIDQGSGPDFQRTVIVFDSTETNESRLVYTRRVYHYEVPDTDPKNPLFTYQPQYDRVNVAGPVQYYKKVAAANAKDESQFLDVEVIDELTIEEEISGRESTDNSNMNTVMQFGRIFPQGRGSKITTWALRSRTDLLLQDPLVPVRSGG
jgi:hypothetical protein